MKLKRTFISGTDNEKNTHEIGEFKYSVERTYTGECFLVGGTLIAMNGEIHDIDEMFGDRRVGFFNMVSRELSLLFLDHLDVQKLTLIAPLKIDTTEERKNINLK